MVKLSKALKVKVNGETKELKEFDINDDNFTGGSLIRAERQFLLEGNTFPQGDMEGSRSYLGYVIASILNADIEDIKKLPAKDYITITNVVKDFFIDPAYQEFMKELLKK